MVDLTADWHNHSAGDRMPETHFRHYSGNQRTWLNEDRPDLGDPQYGNGLFAASDPMGEPSQASQKYYRVVSKRSFSRPILLDQPALHITAWARVNGFRHDAVHSHGANFHFCHEDSTANYLIGFLRKGRKFTLYKEDRKGDTVKGWGRGLKSVPFNWSLDTRYRLDVVLTTDTITAYVNGSEMLSHEDSDLRVGNVGWRGDRTDMDWGGIVVRGD